MCRIIKVLLVLCCLSCAQVESANILGVFLFPSISHQIVYLSLCKELSLRGHQVTIVTTNPLNDPNLVNLTEIDLSSSYDFMEQFLFQEKLHKNLPITTVMANMFEMAKLLTEKELTNPEFQALLHDESKSFDVFIVEFMVPVVYPLAAKYNCPMIGICSMGALSIGHDAVGNPTHPALYPEPLLPFTNEDLTFFQRVVSALFEMCMRAFARFLLLPLFEEMVKEYLGEDLPSIVEAMENTSLLFLNTNPIIHKIRPHVPAIVELGNMHIREKQPLPEDLQIELDAARNGAIYFSLGSNVKSANLPEDTIDIIVQVLGELPYKVIWKWEDDKLPNIPNNVMIRKWYPQQDILGHPNIIAFITQGGLQSLEEAIDKEVPMIILPVLGDQTSNSVKMTKLGIALSLDIVKFDKKQLKETILQVAQNDTFKTNIKKVKELINDQPMTSMEKAVWWTEYIIRHKGAPHLRSPALDMPWYKYYLVDVYVFILICMLLIMYITFKLFCLICIFCKKINRKSNKIKIN